ncbi:MAG: GGDEF domain-containing protein [Clostridiales bacterium]|jgi:diguanylate cyclase|nr:GGDEF domain-containing protein [Clostridiales bacterium]
MAWLKRHWAVLLFSLTVAAIAAALIAIAYGSRMEDLRLKPEPPERFVEDWEIESGGEWTALAPLKGENFMRPSKPERIRNVLPDDLAPGMSLAFVRQQVAVRALVGGEPVFETGFSDKAPFTSFFGASWTVIDLPANSAGKELVLELYPEDEAVIALMRVGSRGTVLLSILISSLPRLFFCIVFLMIGLLAVLFSAFAARAGSRGSATDFFYGLFVLDAALWIATDDIGMQFLCGNIAVLTYLSVFSLMLLAPCLMLFLRTRTEKYRPLLDAMCGISLLYTLVRFALSALNILDIMSDYMRIAHIQIALYIGIVVWICLRNRDSARARAFLRAVLALAVCCAAALVLFYLHQRGLDRSYYAIAFMAGVLMFCVILGIERVRSNLKLAHQALMAKYFERQAYTDYLTGLGNFAACERALAAHDALRQPLSVMMFDLNNLKETNDCYGHSAGNELILCASNDLREAFQGVGTVYRIGGDEFVALMPGVYGREADSFAERLLKNGFPTGRTPRGIPVRIAFGIAWRGPEEWKDAREIIRLADEDMYLNKERGKGTWTTQPGSQSAYRDAAPL